MNCELCRNFQDLSDMCMPCNCGCFVHKKCIIERYYKEAVRYIPFNSKEIKCAECNTPYRFVFGEQTRDSSYNLWGRLFLYISGVTVLLFSTYILVGLLFVKYFPEFFEHHWENLLFSGFFITQCAVLLFYGIYALLLGECALCVWMDCSECNDCNIIAIFGVIFLFLFFLVYIDIVLAIIRQNKDSRREIIDVVEVENGDVHLEI